MSYHDNLRYKSYSKIFKNAIFWAYYIANPVVLVKKYVLVCFFWKELYIAKNKVVPIGVLGSLGFYVWFLWLKHLWYHKSCLMNVLPSNTPQGILYSLPITAFVSADNSTSSLLRKQNSSWSCMFIKNGWSWTTSVAWMIQSYPYILKVITHKWELVTAGVFCVFQNYSW